MHGRRPFRPRAPSPLDLDRLRRQAPPGSTLCQLLNRHLAVRCLWHGMPAKETGYLCEVPERFLRRVQHELEAACDDGSAGCRRRGAARRHRGCAPGVWSLCRTKAQRTEVAMFLVDWLRHEAPFEPRPDPGTFLAVYEHYRAGWWGNQERSPLTPAACLALIRLLIGGQLELADCLGCRQPFARPAGGSMHAFRSLCPFCDFPHAAARPLTLPPRLSIAA